MQWNEAGWNEFEWNEGVSSVLALTAFSVIAETGYNKVYVTAGGVRVEIWRQYAGEAPRALTRTLPVGTDVIFYDYNPINALQALYWAVAVDGAGNEQMSSTATATQNFGGAYVHAVVRAATTTLSGSLMLLNNQEGAARAINVDHNILHLPAYDKPIIEISQTVQRVWRIPLILTDLSDGTREILNSWIENHTVLCGRDERARRMFAVMQKVKEGLDLTGNYPFELIETDFREHIKAA